MKPALDRLREMLEKLEHDGSEFVECYGIEHCVKCQLEALFPTLAEEQQAAERWKQEVTGKLVLNLILKAEHETNPRKALNDLIAWECRCALDPAISEAAAKLQGDAQAMVAAAECEMASLADAVNTEEKE